MRNKVYPRTGGAQTVCLKDAFDDIDIEGGGHTSKNIYAIHSGNIESLMKNDFEGDKEL